MERADGLISSPPRVIQGVTLKFPAKLWRIINRCISGAVSWNINGTAIIIRRELFEDEYLSVNGHFKTTNFASFVRQLNIYGFRKLITRQRWYERDSIFEYYHPCFQRGHPELLPTVVRNAKKGDILDMVRNSEDRRQAEQPKSNRLNKVIFVDNLSGNTGEQSSESSGTSHPLLISKYSSTLKLTRTKYGRKQSPPTDMQMINPARLHQQVAGVVPGMDVGDEDNDERRSFTMKSTSIKTEHEEFDTRTRDQPAASQTQLSHQLFPVSVHKSIHQNPMMTSPDLSLLSQSSTESDSPRKSMELMFSSILPQDDHDADCLTSPLRDSFETLDNTESSPETGSNLLSTSMVCNMSMANDSTDLDSYPFPLGDTLLEYNDDDMGVFTPAYFNPSTGMVTLLLPGEN